MLHLEKLNSKKSLRPSIIKGKKKKSPLLESFINPSKDFEHLKKKSQLKENSQHFKVDKKKVYEKPKQCFIYFRRSKRNIIISVCDIQNRVKAVLSIGHLKVNKIKLKVRARKASYNLKKLSYMLGSLVYKGGFTHLYLKFKNDFPKKLGLIFLNTLKSNKKFKFNGIRHYVSKPHNGCRRPKIRRK
jgi:ribosomal protein S11